MSPEERTIDRVAVLERQSVSRETIERLDRYVACLDAWQAKTNLVAPSTLPQVWSRHIEDSMAFTAIAPKAHRWVDLGSGGGFPGIVIAILLAEQDGSHVDLVESIEKKAAFLRAVIRECGLRANVHATRIERVGDLLGQAEAVSARALAGLDTLFGFVAGRVPNDIPCYFAKGRSHDQEILDASAHWDFKVVKHVSRVEPDSAILEIRNISARNPAN